jgi:predicted Zn finger-like uncharacterized protein
MDITCGDCGARFRLDMTLLKGTKGIRVRCRRCGGKIVVLRPEDPPVLSAEDVVPIDPGVSSSEPKGERLPVPEEGTGARADLSGDLRPEPAPSLSDDMTVPPSSAPALDPQEAVAGEDAAIPRPMPRPERKVSSGGRSYMVKYLIVAGIAILLLAGGTFYYRTAKPGGERFGKLVPAYDIRDVKLSFEKQAAIGTLFVIKGKVANSGKGPSGGIGIRVTLQGKDNQALAEKTAFAGNILDVASLRQMDRAGIDAAMSNRFGEGNVNKEIPPGKALPFLVVFFDPPGGIEAVKVTAIDAR